MGGRVASGYVAYVTDYRHLADLAARRKSPCSEDLAGLSEVRASMRTPQQGLPYLLGPLRGRSKFGKHLRGLHVSART